MESIARSTNLAEALVHEDEELAPDRGPTTGGASRSDRVRGWLYRYMLVLFLGALIATFSVLLPDTFATFANFRTILATQAVLVIVALGLTFPLAAGEFDLSFGAVLGFSSVLLAVLTVNHGWPLGLAVLAVIGCGVLIGAFNAVLAVGLGINSLIITIGTGTVLTGLTLAVSGNQVIPGASGALRTVATGELFGLPYPVYFGFALAAVCWYVYQFTPLGRYVYFTGEGPEVARLAGLPVTAIKAGSLVTVSVFAAVAGVLLFGRLGSADPNIGSTFMLPGFATVFLGSTTIRPGRFNAWGTLIAVYVLIVGITGLQLLGGAGWLEQTFNGAALVVAVTFAQLVRRARDQ